MNKLQPYKKDLLAVGILFGIIIAFYWSALTLKGLYYSGDIRSGILPWRMFVIESLKSGQSCFWYPYLLAGYPYFGEYGSGLFYPFTYLFFYPLPPHAAINYYFVFHYLVSTLGMYLLAKQLRLSPLAGFTSALIYVFSGNLLMRLNHPTIIEVIALAPFVLLLIELAFRRNRWIYNGLAGLLCGFLFIGGHPQYTVYIFLLGAFYIMWRTLTTHFPEKWSFLIYSLILYGCLFLGISMLTAISLKEVIEHTYRYQGTPWENMVKSSLPVTHLIRFFVPFYFGRPYEYQYPDMSFIETCGYIGIGSFFLMALNLTSRNPNSIRQFFRWVFVVALVLALGKYTPIYSIIRHLPILQFTRCPGRFLFFCTISGALLTGIAMDELKWEQLSALSRVILREICLYLTLLLIGLLLLSAFNKIPGFDISTINGKDNLLRILIIALNVLSVTLWAIHKIPDRYFKYAMTGLLAVDLVMFGQMLKLDAQKLTPLPLFYCHPPAVNYLQQDTSKYRIFTLTNQTWDNPEDVATQNEVLHRGISKLFNIESFHTYCSSGFWRFLQLMGPLQEDYLHHPVDVLEKSLDEKIHILEKANVKYILSYDELHQPDLEKVFSANRANIYRLKHVLPRAYFTSTWFNVNQPELALSLATSPVTITENLPSQYQPDGNTVTQPVDIKTYKNNYIALNVQSDRDGLLVLADYDYPSWKVYVDGKESRIYTANYMFRCVHLPKGVHQVEFKFSSASFNLGLGIFTATLLLFLLFIGIMVWKSGRSKLF